MARMAGADSPGKQQDSAAAASPTRSPKAQAHAGTHEADGASPSGKPKRGRKSRGTHDKDGLDQAASTNTPSTSAVVTGASTSAAPQARQADHVLTAPTSEQETPSSAMPLTDQGEGPSAHKAQQQQQQQAHADPMAHDMATTSSAAGPAADTSGELSITSQNAPISLSATLSRGPYHQCGTARRVKVYELKGETWFDRGTGYCAGVYDELNDAALLVTRMEETSRRLTLGVGDEAHTSGGEDSGGGALTASNESSPSKQASAGQAQQDDDPTGAEGREDREHYVLVVSETLDSEDLLLKARVVKDDVYQRQQDTLVVWTEPDGTDMALSFQEADGCHEVWEFLTEVQKHFLMTSRSMEDGLDMEEGDAMTSGMLGMSAGGMTTENDLVMSDGSPFALPDPRLDNLHIIEITLKDAASRSPQAREKVAEWILREDYIVKLVPTFHDAEDLEQLEALHRMCAIMHTIIMLNDNVLVERILRDDVYMGAVGMLEYDPEFPRLKASYRDYLTKTARFRQVVPIPDEIILNKIHQTFRLQYLKDVILARTLDDSTFAVLNSLIFYHQADIVVFCTSSEALLSSLFQLFEPERREPEEKKAEAIIFLQQLCAVGKQVQLPSRLSLYRTLTEWGLLIVLEYAFMRREPQLRNAAAEIFMSIIEYDASGVRLHILDQVEKKSVPLLTKLANILHEVDGDIGLKTQITESLRILFDSGPDGTSGGAVIAQTLAAAAANDGVDGLQRRDESERFLNWLYDGEVDHLFAPLKQLKSQRASQSPSLTLSRTTTTNGNRGGQNVNGAQGKEDKSPQNPRESPPEANASSSASQPLGPAKMSLAPKSALLNHLCELLTFIMIHHHFRSQYWVISSEVGSCVATLLFAREKHLRLAALRFFRACLAKGNQFVNRHFIKIDLLQSILSVIESESSRDNLVTSACLEFFEHIRKEPVKPLINHLMERHGARVRELTRHQTIGHYFQAMILQWEKGAEAATAPIAPTDRADESDQSLSSFDVERNRRLRDLTARGENRATMDSEEENYFLAEEDEGERGEENYDEDEDVGNREAEESPAKTATSTSYPIRGRARSGSGLVPYVPDEDEERGGSPSLDEDEQSGLGDVSNASSSAAEGHDGLSVTSESSTATSSIAVGGNAKRKKRQEEEEEEDDMVGRLAKRKSLKGAPNDQKCKTDESATETGEGDGAKKLSINVSASAVEALGKGHKGQKREEPTS